MGVIISILSLALTLGILVTVHEFGHYWVARRCGVKVLRFSVGFGKVLYSRTDKNGTEFAIAAIPLGGYVKMLDEREGEVAPELLDQAFNRKTVWQRMAVVLAGPIANILFAIFAYWLMFMVGVTQVKPIIGEVEVGSAAQASGLKSQQEIQSISGGLIGAQETQTFPVCVKTGYSEETCTMKPYQYNYWFAFEKAPIPRYLMNGVIVTLSIFIIQVLVALPCAYALAKLRFYGREFVFSMVLFCLLIPVHGIALPLYVMLAQAGLVDTYSALILPWTISVFGIFLMRQFFMTVPDELIDAARMDGMGEYAIVWKVMLPTAIPALLAFAIFSVVAHWNDYFWPRMVITGNRDLFTPPLGIREFRGGIDSDEFGPMMASIVTVTVPLIVAFIIAQKRFIEGITLTGMK